MLLRRLREWVWEGTMEPDLTPLPVDLARDTRFDQLEEYSATISSVVANFEGQIQALQRRRAAEQVAPTPQESGRGDSEIRNLAKGLLPSLDALDRIIDYGERFDKKDDAFDNWLGSVKALRIRLLRTLESIGITPIHSIGSEVDLEIHDVVAVVPAGKHPPNTVVSEQLRGYLFRGKLLRDAKVVVAQ